MISIGSWSDKIDYETDGRETTRLGLHAIFMASHTPYITQVLFEAGIRPTPYITQVIFEAGIYIITSWQSVWYSW